MSKKGQRPNPPVSDAYELALAKLESSGLPASALTDLRLEVLEGRETLSLHPTYKELPALKLTYWNPMDPTEPLSAWPEWPPFYRLRYLKQDTSFASLTKAKPLRYVQEPDSGVCAYFAPNFEWPPVLMNPDEPLIITEGEFKAAKACHEGYATIGLGGVHNFRSSKLGIPFLNELELVVWPKRNVYLIYDSDFKTNEHICQALNMLGDELVKRGAIPHMVALPDVIEGGKTGLDDYLLHRPAEELADLLRTRAQPLGLAKPLWQLNSEVVYIHNPGLVLVQATQQKLAPTAFKEHAYATLDYSEQVVKDDGSISLKPVSAAMAWLKWPMRREAGSLTYQPGSERFLEDGKGRGIRYSKFNTWPGWGLEPAAGDVSPFLHLVDHLFTGTEPAAKTWFLRWCAHPLRYPGTKLFSSAVIYGIKHGTGKSLVGYTLGRIYGSNFTEISQSDLHNGFNEWAEMKQFVLGDDVTGSNKREDNDKLKKLITQEKMRINLKHVQSFEVPDCINYMFTSNQPDAFFLEDNDRRFFIHEVLVPPLDEVFYMEYLLWLDTGGAAAVFHYLRNLDLGDFNPSGHAFMTTAKERMIQDVKSDLGSWVARLVADPDHVLRVGEVVVQGDLFTNKQLLAIYDPEGKTRTTGNGLGRELRRAGILQALGGKPIRTHEGQDRYYIIRRRERWTEASGAELAKYLDDLSALKASVKKKY